MNKGDFIIGGGNSVNRYEKIQIYQLVNSGTTGTLSVPKTGGGTIETSRYEIVMDSYSGGQDALCLKTENNFPIDALAKTEAGAIILTTLNGTGNRTYTLSGTPSSYPVAVVFEIFVGFSDSAKIDVNYILEREQVAPVQSVNGQVGSVVLGYSDVGAEPSGAVSTHNTDKNAHSGGFNKIEITKADSSAITDFLINPTSKTSGNLIDAQVNGVSKFLVDYRGYIGTDLVPITNNSKRLGSGSLYFAFSYIAGINVGGSDITDVREIIRTTGDLAITAGNTVTPRSMTHYGYFGATKVGLLNISTQGNISIHTTTPTANFQVNQSTTGTGTVSVAAGGTTWTGVGTQFLNTFKVGDTITSEGQTLTISAIASDTSLTTNAVGAAISGKAYTLVGGTRFQVFGNGNVGVGGVPATAKFSVSEKSAMNELGGFMVKMTNKTAANSVKGTVVYVSPTTNNAFAINPLDGDMPIGVVYENGIADGSECWIVISGIAEVLLVDSVAATRSYVAYSSATTAGRIDTAASVPDVATHFKEIGHTLESKAAGTNVLVKCILHFN